LPRVALAAEHLPRHTEESPPKLGRLDAARPAIEQLDPKILLEPPHMVGNGRLRQRQRLRRLRKPAMLRNRVKRPQLSVLHLRLAFDYKFQ
jgi:hypothetical protein